ncbi:MAG: hypothetical protein WC333_01555 [Dehalococcoidia bacterium]|jgi:hypothetical protein
MNVVKQEYCSAKSCIKQIPAGFGIVSKYFGWKPNTVNFDIGGGKYDLMTEKLKEKGVTNLVYDPYNRSQIHNIVVTNNVIFNNGVNTVTIFNVLNVIMEKEIQLKVIKMAYNALKTGGMLFVRSTYMNPAKASGLTKSGTFQHYLTQIDYLKIVRQIFPHAELKHGIIFATK